MDDLPAITDWGSGLSEEGKLLAFGRRQVQLREYETDKRALARMDSPRRVAWLRERLHGYTLDLAAREFFRLETWVCDEPIDSPKVEALNAFIETTYTRGLMPVECMSAFEAEWRMCMQIAVEMGQKFKIMALSHLKLGGNPDAIASVFLNARQKFPSDWPFLSEKNLADIAAGFQNARTRKVS